MFVLRAARLVPSCSGRIPARLSTREIGICGPGPRFFSQAFCQPKSRPRDSDFVVGKTDGWPVQVHESPSLGGRALYVCLDAVVANGQLAGFHAEGTVRPGTVLLEVDLQPQEIQAEADMHTIQVGEGEHWSAQQSAVAFTSHATDPNCYFRLDINSASQRRTIRIVCRREFEVSEPITVNYNTFELDMSSPFFDNATKTPVQGFLNCGPEERAFLVSEVGREMLFPHVRAAAQERAFLVSEVGREMLFPHVRAAAQEM